MTTKRTIIVELPMLKSDVVGSFGRTGKEALAWLKKRYGITLPKYLVDDMIDYVPNKDKARTYNLVPEGGGVLILFSENPSPDIIPHEAFHAVVFTMNRLNTPLSNDTEEIYAYTLGYLTQELLK